MSDSTKLRGLWPRPAVQSVLFLGLLGNAMGHAFLFALMPSLGRQIGLADAQTGLLLGLGSLGLLVAAPVWGFAAERWGRRPVFLSGLFAAAATAALFGLVIQGFRSGALALGATFVLLVTVRLLQALATGGLLPAAQAFVADSTTPEHRSGGMGMLGAAFGLGGILGAALLWALAETSLSLGFWCLAVVIAVAAAACWRLLPEPARRKLPGDRASGAIPWRAIWPSLLITLLGVMTYGLLQQVTGFRLQDSLGLNPQQAAGRAGAVLTASAAAMVLAQGVVLRRLRWPPARLVTVGAALSAAALIGLSATQAFMVILAAMILLGFSLGLVLPANLALLSLRTGGGAQGRVAGINAVGQGLGLVAGPVFGGALYQALPAGPYLAAAVVMIIVGFLALRASGDLPYALSEQPPAGKENP